jgi:molecular chaperone Hsp33
MSEPVEIGQDDSVLPFAVEPLDIRGRVVRLGPAADAILDRHGYPPAVSRVLGEAMALTVLLGSALKDNGRFQIQTKGDGPINMIVVDFDAPGRLRAYARFDADAVASAVAAGKADTGALLGSGLLALTIEQGRVAARYQGIVALEGQGLEEAAHQYFRQSEQIPTRVRLAVGETLSSGEGAGTVHRYRAGGIMVQFLPTSPDRMRLADLPPGDAPEGHRPPDVAEDDAWVEAKALVDTVEDHELLDPGLSSERLLIRLFHERGVRVFERVAVNEGCSCSRERILGTLRRFPAQDRADMVGTDGRIGVTCEFCARHYDIAPADIELQEPPSPHAGEGG